MPRGGHNKKDINQKSFVECSCCYLRLTKQQIEEHWDVYKNGGKSYPPHRRTAWTKLYNRLTDPTDKTSKSINEKSVFSLLKMKDPNESKENLDGEWIIDGNYEHKKYNKKPPKQPAFGNIKEFFDKINENILEEEKLNHDEKYFNEKIKSIMKRIEDSKIRIDDLLETEELDFHSHYALLDDINQTLLSSKQFVHNISNVFSQKTMNVYTLCDLILKYYYNGSRITHHGQCEEGYALKYCVACCDEPKYPEDGHGNIIKGRLVNLNVHMADPDLFLSLKNADRQHFKDPKHWSNLLGHNKHNDEVFEAQQNHFRLMLRMILSNDAMAQWKNWLYFMILVM